MNSTEQNAETKDSRKIYYSIGEVCAKTGLEPHVLRYWENEFPQLRPKKNRAGNRAYREKDIETISFIKHLLYEEQYTIPGAKKRLAETRATERETTPLPTIASEPVSESIPLTLASQENIRETVVQQLQDVLRILRS